MENLTINNTEEDNLIESEDEQELTDPFNPEDISIESKLVSMETCLRRLTQKTITLNPDFQRQEVWTMDKRSQLIESMMLMIPLPMFYVSADEKNNYTVVDGLQRLSTIRRFVLGDDYIRSIDKDPQKGGDERLKGNGFKLVNLEFWKSYEGLTFNQLPNNIRNRILETEFRFTVINPGTPEEVKRNIFKRLNTGGMPLSSQEIRNALYLGPATVLLNEMAKIPEFTTATGGSLKSLRMEDKELILRFVAFLVRDYSTYRKTVGIDTYLSDTMIILNALPGLQTRELQKAVRHGSINPDDIRDLNFVSIKESFRIAMRRAHELFGIHAFRKSYGNNRRAPVNKALFETWGVILSDLTEEQFARLKVNRQSFMTDYIPIISDYEFDAVISKISMNATAVKYRFEKFNEIVQTHIK